jgi:exonuclease VII large subunit
MSNDIGFVRTPTGFSAVISDYDGGRYGETWLRQLNARYEDHLARKQERLAEEERRRAEEERKRLVEAQRQAVHERARKLGYRVEETREGDRLRLVLVKRVY